jgi:hypothetical protein
MEACPLKNLSLAHEAVDDENMNVQYFASGLDALLLLEP